MTERRRSYLALWLVVGALLLGLAATLVLVPLHGCPVCEGEGGSCGGCDGRRRISLLGRWSDSHVPLLVGAVEATDWKSRVLPLSHREKILIMPGSVHLGIVEFHAYSLRDVRRAREILARDAQEKAYKFWCPGRAVPW